MWGAICRGAAGLWCRLRGHAAPDLGSDFFVENGVAMYQCPRCKNGVAEPPSKKNMVSDGGSVVDDDGNLGVLDALADAVDVCDMFFD